MDIQQLLRMFGGLGQHQEPVQYTAGAGAPAPQIPPQAPVQQPQTFMQKLGGGLGRLRDRVTPVDPSIAANMDPNYLKQLRNQAIFRTGIGMMGASERNGFGGSLAAGLGAGLGNFQGEVNNAYVRQQKAAEVKREEDRQALLDQRFLEERGYKRNRDSIEDQQWQKTFDANEQFRKDNMENQRELRRISNKAKNDSISVYDDPMTRRRAALSLMSDPTKIRELASFGEGGQEIRNILQKEMTQIQKETGMTPGDFIRIRAMSAANTKNLNTLVAQEGQVGQAVTLAKANGQRALELINKIDDTGVPIIEGARRAAARGVGGVNEAELKTVLVGFQSEVARLLSGHPEMRGQITNELRTEIEQMTPANMTAAQAKRVINRLFVELDVRQQAVEDAINNAVNAKQMGLGGGSAESDPFTIDFSQGSGLGAPMQGPGGMTLSPGQHGGPRTIEVDY